MTIAALASPANVNSDSGSNIRKCTGRKKNGTCPRRTIATVTQQPSTIIAAIQPVAI